MRRPTSIQLSIQLSFQLMKRIASLQRLPLLVAGYICLASTVAAQTEARLQAETQLLDAVEAGDRATVRVLIEERLNTYVENQPLELLASGDMLWWSERDGWAHLYLFGADGTLRHRLEKLSIAEHIRKP